MARSSVRVPLETEGLYSGGKCVLAKMVQNVMKNLKRGQLKVTVPQKRGCSLQ